MDNLKFFDIYGSQVHFAIFYRSKYYSKTGGILSIISILCVIFIFMLFSQNYFKRETRKDSVVTINTGHKKIRFGNEKIWLPWSISDYEVNLVDFKDHIFPEIKYYYGERDNITGGFNLQYKLLPYKRCNETPLVEQDYLITKDISRLYCIDMDDIIMGGDYFLADFIYQIEFNFYICKDGVNFDSKNPDCINYEELEKVIGPNEAWHFEIYYPEVQFQPSDIKRPMLVVYNSHYYHFSRFSNAIDRMYLQQYILNDDLGWIMNNNKNITSWGIKSISGASYSNAPEGSHDIIGGTKTSRLYSLNIFVSPYTTYYQRTYTKLFDVVGEIFPVLNTIIVVFSFISEKVKNAELQEYYLNTLIENQGKREKVNEKLMNKIIQSSSNAKRINIYNSKNSQNIQNSLGIGTGNIIENFSPCLVGKPLCSSSVAIPFQTNLMCRNKLNIKKSERKWFCFRYIIAEFCSCQFEKCLPKSFFLAAEYLHKTYDISTFINIVKQFSLLENAFCQDFDFSCLNSIDKHEGCIDIKKNPIEFSNENSVSKNKKV